ncbi:hypothetical protein [Treponema socranskii]|uniref:hypothetical protein n=1 Tax=Treponema socranskii TaxID=53419 RepID=UPI0028712951|nr:hypothetical protein [Treponema socranskii]MDR9859524.1 hypothetical protein [Treponema socranskii]
MKTDTSIRAADIAACTDLHADGMLCAILRQARVLSAEEIVIGKAAVTFKTHGAFCEKMTLQPPFARRLADHIASLAHLDGRTKLCGRFIRRGVHPFLLYTVVVQGGIVLRIPVCPRVLPPLEGLGLCSAQIEALRKLSTQRSGLIIFCLPDERRISTAAVSIFSDMRRTGKAFCVKPPCILHLHSEESVNTAIETARTDTLVFALLAASDVTSAFMQLKKYRASSGDIAGLLRCIIAHELLYDGSDIHLLFDIAFPACPLKIILKGGSPAPDTDDSFTHCTNVAAEILKSLKRHSRLPRTVKPAVSGESIVARGKKFMHEAAR